MHGKTKAAFSARAEAGQVLGFSGGRRWSCEPLLIVYGLRLLKRIFYWAAILFFRKRLDKQNAISL